MIKLIDLDPPLTALVNNSTGITIIKARIVGMSKIKLEIPRIVYKAFS